MKSKKETIEAKIIDAMKKIHPKIKVYIEQLEAENKRLKDDLEREKLGHECALEEIRKLRGNLMKSVERSERWVRGMN